MEKSTQGFETIQHPVALKDNSELRLQLLEQLLLVNLIVGRWLLPKGDISREQLSQILLAYLAISSDIVEFFDVFKEKVVYSNSKVQTIVLTAWTLSLLQFPFVLTVSRARKMRVAITNDYEQLFARQRPRSCFKAFYDVDIWAIFLANALQDVPFLLTRLYLMTVHNLVTYTMIFFFFKNMLIILLQTYRSIIIINDRYINPKPPDMDIIEHNMDLMKSSRADDIDDDYPSSSYHKSHYKHHEKQGKKEKKREKKSKKASGHKNGNRNNGNETPKKTRRSSSTTPTRTPKQRRTSRIRSISEEREQLFPRHHGRRMDRLDTLEET
ncbi:hypothetical protein CAEBREN_22370 [Caenorhabditis brenneri]|uniref:Uncharacterized protein n=1 Tax=Caenorhabditis brenneri TaxID=135651 RepID=G0MNP0_CAEBE|nr:hypothetical protein CAEBREN_22370 [Caenorhabditis brenneri]